MTATSAFLRGTRIDDADLLSVIGPGLAPAANAPPLPARDWNAFAFSLGARLLVLYAQQSNAQQHVIDICKTALAMVGGAEHLLGKDNAELEMGMIEATLRPLTMFAHSVAAELQLRIFRWGMRRIRRDRHLRDSLCDIAAAVAEAHAELAARAGTDPGVAREAERAAQRADARAVLDGRAASLTA